MINRELLRGQVISERAKDKKVAFIHDKTPYGQGLSDETRKAANALGVKEVMLEGVNVGDKDFSALSTKMKEAGVDFIHFGGLHTEAGLLVRQMRDQGVNATFMSGDGIVSSEFAAIAGPAAEGVINTFTPDLQGRPENKALVENFKAAGYNPEAYTLYSYAALKIVADAANKVGKSDDAQAVAAAIKASGPWETPIGAIGYNEKGDNDGPAYVMYTWKKGPDGNLTYIQD